jgi:hypothetical protein
MSQYLLNCFFCEILTVFVLQIFFVGFFDNISRRVKAFSEITQILETMLKSKAAIERNLKTRKNKNKFLHCPFFRHQCRRCPDPHRPRKERCPEGAAVQHPLAKTLLLPKTRVSVFKQKYIE